MIILCLVEDTRKSAKHQEAAGQWDKAAELYLWLFKVCTESTHKGPIGIDAMAVLFEFAHAVGKAADVFEKQKRDSEAAKAIRGIEKQVCEILLKSPLLGDFSSLYSVQKRSLLAQFRESGENSNFKGFDRKSTLHEKVIKDTNSLYWAYDITLSSASCNATDILDLTPLHYAVISGKKNIVERLLKDGADALLKDSL